MSHVLLVTPNVAVDGGVAAHVRSTARALIGAGHRVSIVSGDAGGDLCIPRLSAEGLDAEGMPLWVRALDELRPHVVHVHHVDDPQLVAAAKRHAGVVVSAHGYTGCAPNTYYFEPGHECTRAHGPGCVGNMLLRGCAHLRDPRTMIALYRRVPDRLAALRLADATVAYSDAVAAHLQRNDVPDPAIVPLLTEIPADLTPLPIDRRILFVGRVAPAKGLLELLEAIARIDAVLEVCGDGWLLPRARRLAESLGIAERVEFSGWRTGEALERSYRRARVVALPSVWPEPFGLVGLEALARGRPVVASDTGGIRSWMDDGKTGRLVPPGDVPTLADALDEMLGDSALAARMGRVGRQLVESRFSAATHVAALEAVYKRARRNAQDRLVPTVTA